jgi:hypothetical protein
MSAAPGRELARKALASQPKYEAGDVQRRQRYGTMNSARIGHHFGMFASCRAYEQCQIHPHVIR